MSEIYISNIEEVLVPGARATGDLAKKVGQISPRSVWYGADTTVLPKAPDPAFMEYAASLGNETRIVVPQGINFDNLSIRDGFSDPLLQEMVRGRTVESYIGDSVLGSLVTTHGGLYVTGGSHEAIEAANDKGRYKEHAEGVVDVPAGELCHGIGDIAAAVHERLARGEPVFVRHTRSGGGLGNRHFSIGDDRSIPTIEEIQTILAGSHYDLWENGSALVEEVLDLESSPGVAFTAESGIAYDFAQVTKGRNYNGCWSPIPPEVVANPEQLTRIGDHMAHRLGELGFKGYADTDLGILRDGGIVGFEINGRSNGVRHAVSVGETVWKTPWREWRARGLATKAIDNFALRQAATFGELHQAMQDSGLPLASPDNPTGVVINIPPAGNLAGIQVLAEGYKEAESIYQATVDAIGHPVDNKEDFPLFKGARA